MIRRLIVLYFRTFAIGLCGVAWFGMGVDAVADSGQTEAEVIELVEKAGALPTQDLVEPVRATGRDGTILWAPNPDGQTWDFIQIF